MTRRQFLNDLYRRLGSLSTEEAEQHLTYYAEMLADRMEEGMTEEEAVASMESVDTIAQSILQDAGVPERSVFDDPVDDFTEEKPKKKRRWWIGGLIAAVVILLLLPALAIGGLIAFNMVDRTDGIRIDTDEGYVEMDANGIHVESDGKTVHIGPDGIGVSEEAVVDGSYYAADREPDTVSTQNIHSIQVEWPVGNVWVTTWDGDEIRFVEMFGDSKSSHSDSDRLSYAIDEGELEIRFNSRKGTAYTGKKWLKLEIPADWDLSELEIETASADVDVDDVDMRNLHVETASGNILVKGEIPCIETDTASGWVSISCSETLRELEVDTASGDVDLTVEKDAPFVLEYDTASGTLDNASAIAMEHKGNFHSRGSGGPQLKVETASGDLQLTEMYR